LLSTDETYSLPCLRNQASPASTFASNRLYIMSRCSVVRLGTACTDNSIQVVKK
jgi:hypothetical protein